MYHQFNIQFPQLDCNRLQGQQLQTYGNLATKTTNYLIRDWSYFLGLHEGRLHFHILPDYAYFITVQGTDMLWPHIDPDTTCALNFYIDPAGATTSFYRELPGLTYHTQQDLAVPDHEHLVVKGSNDLSHFELLGSFTAEPYSAYLMRVDMWHSVSRPQGVRSMLSWRWNHADYDSVLNSIQVID